MKGKQVAPFTLAGMTGATAANRWVGATTSGPPTSGTFAVGDWTVARDGAQWVCITAGTPGTWTRVNDASSRLSKHFRCR